MSFNVVSLFSGCGGSSLGYMKSGGKILMAVEFDKHAASIYKANFPNIFLYKQDICKLTIEEIKEKTGIKEKELDILDGSPPCQGFSIVGKRNLNDKRNQLFKEYVRILNGLKLMNAKNYGVPQSRERTIFIGIREDFNLEPSYPAIFEKFITVKQALENCPEDEFILIPKGFIAELSKKIQQGEIGSKYHPKGHFFSLVRASWEKCSPTILKTVDAGRGGVLHPELNRFLTISEVKRLCSFPDDFIFTGKFEQKWARLGNAVPPKMMQAIASHIYKEILTKQTG